MHLGSVVYHEIWSRPQIEISWMRDIMDVSDDFWAIIIFLSLFRTFLCICALFKYLFCHFIAFLLFRECGSFRTVAHRVACDVYWDPGVISQLTDGFMLSVANGSHLFFFILFVHRF